VKLKAPDLGKILLEHLAKDDSTIRTYAADALGDVKPDGAADALAAAFTRAGADATYTVRAAVLAALAKFGAAAALPTLRAAITDAASSSSRTARSRTWTRATPSSAASSPAWMWWTS